MGLINHFSLSLVTKRFQLIAWMAAEQQIVQQRVPKKDLIFRVSATRLYTKPNGYGNVPQSLRIKNLGDALVKSGCRPRKLQ